MLRNLAYHDMDSYLALLKQLTVVGEYDENKWREVWDELKHTRNIEIYVIEDENVPGKIVAAGTLIMEKKFIHGGSYVGHIEDVVVSSESRTAGLGKRIVTFLVMRAHSLGAYKVILDCKEAVVPFYEKCGFVKNDYQMRKDLY